MSIILLPVAWCNDKGAVPLPAAFQARRHIVTVEEAGLCPKSGFIELSPVVHLIFDTCIVSINMIYYTLSMCI